MGFTRACALADLAADAPVATTIDGISGGRAILGLGSNLGERLSNLQGAVDALAPTAAATSDPPLGPSSSAWIRALRPRASPASRGSTDQRR